MHRDISQQWKRDIKERILRELQLLPAFRPHVNDTFYKQIIKVKVKARGEDQQARRVFHSVHRRIKHSVDPVETCSDDDCSESILQIIRKGKG
uniref:Uncharacterized protein n=1 Tax=Acrobeloides nanus TaxID=290746 RepID=A0A914CWM9_9BILA